jgi:hypothetical protein
MGGELAIFHWYAEMELPRGLHPSPRCACPVIFVIPTVHDRSFHVLKDGACLNWIPRIHLSYIVFGGKKNKFKCEIFHRIRFVGHALAGLEGLL